MTVDLIIDIDCYQCGNNLSISLNAQFEIGICQIETAYCMECQEGIEVVSEAKTLSIRRLGQE